MPTRRPREAQRCGTEGRKRTRAAGWSCGAEREGMGGGGMGGGGAAPGERTAGRGDNRERGEGKAGIKRDAEGDGEEGWEVGGKGTGKRSRSGWELQARRSAPSSTGAVPGSRDPPPPPTEAFTPQASLGPAPPPGPAESLGSPPPQPPFPPPRTPAPHPPLCPSCRRSAAPRAPPPPRRSAGATSS